MQFQKIVVGLDFTDASLAAARWVATFAPDAEILLAHVVSEPRVPSYVRSQIPSTFESKASGASAVRGGLRALANLIGSDRVRFDVVAGDPPSALAQFANQERADLLCLGRGRRRRGSARFGGNTAQRLLVRTRVPALVVPALHPRVPIRILAAVDERRGGESVFDVGCELGASGEPWVDTLHIIDPEVRAFVRAAAGDGAPNGDVQEHGGSRDNATAHDDASLYQRAREWVDASLENVSIRTNRVTSVIGAGDPGQEIIRHARRSSTDLIVIGRGGDASHASLPSGAFPLGSTTRLVLWAAPCAVLVLPLGSRSIVARAPSSERQERLSTQVVELGAATRRRSPFRKSSAWRPCGSNGDGAA
jgi:nucleotide-binding universal stress UspA family protein